MNWSKLISSDKLIHFTGYENEELDKPDKGAYDGLDEVGIGLLDEGVFDGHAEEVGTSMPGERVFDGHDEVGTDMSGERAFDGHDEVGTGMPGEGVCDRPDKDGNDRPDKRVCDGPDEVGDLHDEVGNCRPDKGVCDGPDEVSDLHDEVGNGRPDKGLCDGLDEVVDLPGERGNGTSKVTKRAADRPVERAATEENDKLVEIDYEQEEEDIAVDTCVDPTGDWDSLRNPEIPREECGSGFEFDCENDDLRSFGDFDDDDEVEGGQPRNFINTRYHEFNHVRDVENPIFKIRIEFASADAFRKAIKAYAIKHKRNIKFQKNDHNRMKAVCKAKDCNWFFFSLLG
ncbi:hypothetical protein LWI28_023403 [Acer negundo]|uniref:Transposase MuDR plant domain-containing protein n=1 Tax=Acer negundo TaxID=4023 RepID=A0AAD5IVJ7_ACENE|nr:hypothetical protein LWI28_023403 [Acer negundo]